MKIHFHTFMDMVDRRLAAVDFDSFLASIGDEMPADPQSPTVLKRELRIVENYIVHHHELSSTPLQPYQDVAQNAIDSLPMDKSGTLLPASITWAKIISDGVEKYQAKGGISLVGFDSALPLIKTRQFAFTAAAKRMRSVGYALSERADGGLHFSSDERRRMVAHMESIIVKLGSDCMISRILAANKYHVQFQRYLGGITFPQDPTGKDAPMPWNFLLLLAIKHLNAIRDSSFDPGQGWEQLLDFSRDFAAVHDVTAGQYEHIVMEPLRITDALQDIGLYESFFQFSQLSTRMAPDFMRGIFGWISNLPDRGGVSWTIDQSASFMQNVFRRAKSFSFRFQPGELEAMALAEGVPAFAVAEFIAVFTHAVPPNENYALIESGGETVMNKPIVEFVDGSRAIPVPSIAAAACVPALALRFSKLKSLGTEVGKAAEQFFRKRLKRCGIPLVYGDYRALGLNGECDGVLETKTHVIFFEVKARTLTRAARQGSVVSMLSDFADSIVFATSQALTAEHILTAQGFIDLTHEGITTRVDLADREVAKVVISLDDFGRFNDRLLTHGFLRALLGVSVFSSQISRDNDRLKEVNIKVSDYINAITRLSTDDPFYNLWCLSLPQVFELADHWPNPEAFKKGLFLVRNFSTGTADWYREVATRAAMGF